MAPVGPVVLGVWIVNDEVRASFTAGLSRQQLLRREVDELEHSIDGAHLKEQGGKAAGVHVFQRIFKASYESAGHW